MNPGRVRSVPSPSAPPTGAPFGRRSAPPGALRRVPAAVRPPCSLFRVCSPTGSLADATVLTARNPARDARRPMGGLRVAPRRLRRPAQARGVCTALRPAVRGSRRDGRRPNSQPRRLRRGSDRRLMGSFSDGREGFASGEGPPPAALDAVGAGPRISALDKEFRTGGKDYFKDKVFTFLVIELYRRRKSS